MSSEIVFGLENAAWPALLVDAGGAVLRANTAALSVFGDAMKGQSPPLSAIWSPENGMAAEQFLSRREQSPETANLKFLTANGAAVFFSISICVLNRDGRKWFVLQFLPAAATAPTAAPVETKAAPDAGLLFKQKLDCALQLARTISLDFNNALTSVLGHASFLLGKAEPGHPWRHSLMEIEKSASHAAEIANELAVFSQHEKQTRRAPAGNLNAVINRCVEFFKNSQGEKISWNLQLEKELFAARFEEAKLQQALTKILENAVEAVKSGGQVAVQTRNVELTEPAQDRNVRLTAGAHVCVEISDNGAGIDPEVLPRIFEPFFTTKKSPHRGLGLALVYGIVTNHGGGVAVSSEPGVGASARIYLPAEKQLAHDNGTADENLHGTETILVVDDESMLLTMAETILTEFGYKVLTANNGQKALALLSRDDVKPDLIVTDLVMPAMGGRELIERVRQMRSQMKIVCTSGCVLSPEQQIGLTYLQKPFTSRDLLTKVRRALTVKMNEKNEPSID
jgi:two-component system, cell cycle sensor histidine kinase and response regulator CckA